MALSRESKALRESYEAFKNGMDPDTATTMLYSRHLLTSEEKGKVKQQALTTHQKVDEIFDCLERRVSTNPSVFHELVKLLLNEPALKGVGQKMQACYEKEQCHVPPPSPEQHIEQPPPPLTCISPSAPPQSPSNAQLVQQTPPSLSTALNTTEENTLTAVSEQQPMKTVPMGPASQLSVATRSDPSPQGTHSSDSIATTLVDRIQPSPLTSFYQLSPPHLTLSPQPVQCLSLTSSPESRAEVAQPHDDFPVSSQLEQGDEPMVINDVNYTFVVCSDEGLRSLSQKLLSKSISSVGRCLGLDESFIHRIENDSTLDDQHKMHQLLIEWKHGEEQATWGNLALKVRSLEDIFLMEELRQVACRQNPERDTESRDVIEEIAFVEAPVEEQSRSVGMFAISRNLFTKVKVKPEVRRKIHELQKKFDDVLLLAQKSFEFRAVPLKELRLKVISLCVNQKQNIPIPMFDQSKFGEINTFSCEEIFSFLTCMEVWDFLNFQVLQDVVEKFIPNDADVSRKISEYATMVDAFKNETNLLDYIRVRGSVTKAMPEYRDVMVKIERDYNRYTLANLSEEEGFLANQFLLNQFIFQLKDVEQGCVQITWLVPASAIELLKPKLLAAKGEVLKERGIREIRVNGRYVYKNPNPKPAPRPLFPHSQTEDYRSMYEQSVQDPGTFWSMQAMRFLQWDQKYTKVNDCQKEEGIVKWFTEGKLNVSKNCLDRHAAKYPDRTAVIWERNEPTHEEISYRELLERTCRVANVLKNQCGVKKGDTVVIYMPTMPLAVASMFACARIGAVHSVVFAVLKPEKLKKRIIHGAKVLITADEAPIGEKTFPLKKRVDKVLEDTTSIQHVLVAKRTGKNVPMKQNRDIPLEKAMMTESAECEPVSLDSEDDLFIMYTSGMTGDPTGVVHTQAGYLLYAAITHKYVFDHQEGDVFACVAVLGWITGHTYVVYGPLCNGATTVLFESTATYPDEGRYWEMVERLKVNQFHTTPAAICRLMKTGDKYVKDYDLSSLKTIGSVGEPLSTAGWKWYFEVVGKKRCNLVDTWWQTETGGIGISPQPGLSDGNLKPGCPMRPFFGMEPVLTNEKGEELEGNGVQGLLCLKNPTPGMCRKVFGCGKTLKNDYFNYFKKNPGLYFTQDYAYRDVDGDYQIQGRKDDLIRIKGVWLQVPEMESEIAQSDDRIEEATIVPFFDPREQKETDNEDSEAEETVAVIQVKADTKEKELAEIATNIWCKVLSKAGLRAVPQRVHFIDKSPMTDSGKISRLEMRQHIMQRGIPDKPNVLSPDPTLNTPIFVY